MPRPETVNDAMDALYLWLDGHGPLEKEDVRTILHYATQEELRADQNQGHFTEERRRGNVEERAFRARLAELKATQVVQVVHGGKVS